MNLYYKEQSKTSGQCNTHQRDLNPMASFGLAVVEKPQLAAKLPVTRPFPP